MTDRQGSSFIDDVMGQPEAAQATLDALTSDQVLLNSLGQLRHYHDNFLLTGMGSSLSALYPAYLRLTAAGLPVNWIEAGELLHFATEGIGRKTLVVMVSQSGESVEILRLLDRIKGQTSVLGVTNEPGSTLAKKADVTMLLRAGKEGIVATKTYVATLAALAVLTGVLTGNLEEHTRSAHRGIASMRGLLQRRKTAAATLAEGLAGRRTKGLFLVGRGPSYASALAGALILKEASHTVAEALTGGAFRHGPLEMVGPGTEVVMFSPAGRTVSIARGLAQDIAKYGGKVVLVGPKDDRLPGATLPIIDTSDADEWGAPFVEVVVPELLAEALSNARGHKTGTFERMGKVTTEE